MTRAELAKLFNVSSAKIGRWIRQGCPQQGGHFDLPAVITWRIKQMVSDAFRALSICKKVDDHDLICAKKAHLVIKAGTRACRDKLLALPAELAPQLINVKSPKRIKGILDAAVRRALRV